MKSRELFINYLVECDIRTDRGVSGSEISESVKKINEMIINFSMSMNFLKGDDKNKSVKWLSNNIHNIQSKNIYRSSENPEQAINDLLLNDLVWYVSDLCISNGKVLFNVGLVIKNNKKLEADLSGDYYKKITPIIEILLSGDLLCEIKLKTIKVDIDAELIQKEKRTITPCKKTEFSNENNI